MFHSPQSFRQSVEKGDFLITAEITPPKGANAQPFLEKAQLLKNRVHGINLTDSNRAVMRMSPVCASVLLLSIGIEPICQLACRDRNSIALQGDLLGAHALGIRSILALTGDPISVGDHPKARSVCEWEAVRLLKGIDKLNQGLDWTDHPLEGPTSFFAGAAVDPQLPSWSGLEGRFNRKLAAGAQFFQSQLITDFDKLDKFMTKLGHASGKPVLAGIFLLKSGKNARFINKFLPGVEIPAHIIERLDKAENPLQEGVNICAEQVRHARQLCQGVHLMAIRKEELIPEILNQAGLPALK